MQRSAHLVVHLQLWRSTHLVVGLRSLSRVSSAQLILLRWRLRCRRDIHLLAVSTGLRSSFDLVLDILSLLFVGLAYRKALAYLELLRPVQGAQMRLLLNHVPLIFVWRLSGRLGHLIRVVDIYQRIVDAVAGVSFRTARPVAALSQRNPPLIGWRKAADLLLGSTWLRLLAGSRCAPSTLSMSRVLLLLLLIEQHLLLDLLLVHLLRWRQVEVVNYVRNVRDSVLLASGAAGRGRQLAACRSSLIGHVLVATEILVVYILHASQSILLLKIACNIGRACLVEAARALESFVIVGSIIWVHGLSLASAMLQ